MQIFQTSPRVQELVERTRRLVRDVLIPLEGDPRQTPHGPTPEFVAELRAAAASAGLLAPQVGRECGGHGLTHLETAAVFRESGYSLLGPVAMNCMSPDEGNMFLLERVATPEQQREFLAPVVRGTHRSAFLMTEPDGAGSDPEMLRTTATRVDGGWRLDGLKWFITGATGAAIGIVMARTGTHATMFLVHMDAPGISVERVLDTLDRSMPGGHGVVRLHEVFVPDAHVLGAVDEGFRYAQLRLAPARLTHCMRWWGAAKRAHDIASDYACRRRAFGKPLIEHEGVGFMLARRVQRSVQERTHA
jgi:acyl-CoA dehydrogenase